MRPATGRQAGVAMALGAALGLWALLASLGPSTPARAQGTPSRTVLTVTNGPRQGEWKRSFNPFRNDSDTRWPALAGVYEPLIVHNRATGTYIPWLATAHQWGADNSSLRFTLRSGVVWSDGTPFSVRDVVFTFDLMRRFPALDRQGVWGFLAGVKAVDPTTVEFVLKRAYTPGLVAIGHQPIVAGHKWKDVADPASFDDPSPVGTGPFTEIRRFEPTVYELDRNRRYWQSGKPAVQTIRVPLYRSNEEVVRALGAGELDWASLFLPDIEKGWVAKDPSHHQYWYPDCGPSVLLLVNTQRKPYDDRSVRKALSLALDRSRITREALRGYAPPADASGLAESQKRWKDETLAAGSEKSDAVAANRLLDAAGLAWGDDRVRVVPGVGAMRYELHLVKGWSDWVAAAGIIRDNLAEVGIAVTVKPLDYDDWVDALELGRFNMGLWFGDRGPTPYQFYRGQMDPLLVRPVGSRATGNFHRFASDEAGSLLRRFETRSDLGELTELGNRLQKLYVEDVPSLPLYASPLWGVMDTTRFTGFPSRFNPYGAAAPLSPPDSLPVLVQISPR
jgi:peptide/nickel transport system substrate-binding protein